MERAEKTGLGIAAAAHVILFGALSAGFLSQTDALKPSPPSMDVSLVPDVALDATAPAATEDPAQSRAPDPGPPEDAAPPAPAEVAPEPEPAPPKPAAAPPRPAPAARPQPAKPEPAKPAPPTPAKSKAPPKPAPATAKPATAAAKGTGKTATATRPRPTGALGDIMRGIVAEAPPTARGQTPRAAVMSQQAAADIGSAIRRQVQPCADRQVIPGPGAEKIRVRVRLNINRDGSLAGRPVILGHDNVDDDNARYLARVEDMTIATFVGCAPLRGLPADLYEVPRGWKIFVLRYSLG